MAGLVPGKDAVSIHFSRGRASAFTWLSTTGSGIIGGNPNIEIIPIGISTNTAATLTGTGINITGATTITGTGLNGTSTALEGNITGLTTHLPSQWAGGDLQVMEQS